MIERVIVALDRYLMLDTAWDIRTAWLEKARSRPITDLAAIDEMVALGAGEREIQSRIDSLYARWFATTGNSDPLTGTDTVLIIPALEEKHASDQKKTADISALSRNFGVEYADFLAMPLGTEEQPTWGCGAMDYSQVCHQNQVNAVWAELRHRGYADPRNFFDLARLEASPISTYIDELYYWNPIYAMIGQDHETCEIDAVYTER
ncbi:uncharacterized protein B0I36DRAFT_356002 [Microdochium trichocladiopsis]|uniref:Uncharacterized protein n=1 Tax=Microdochium trichocladiopsis TaxID=1682393 RepID=A0A9P9BLB0_9PEZI|nr:uncharacterized protein B0I36DRAFT_356002 [Microdochium trichocladiopsis]KAH7012609.1 hypothetical protein B0I36DRAFT_356002 [Microdochium trichocladiopsis]